MCRCAPPDHTEALLRAERLINWMADYIGQMAPGDYADCFADLNAHWIYMEQLRKSHG